MGQGSRRSVIWDDQLGRILSRAPALRKQGVAIRARPSRRQSGTGTQVFGDSSYDINGSGVCRQICRAIPVECRAPPALSTHKYDTHKYGHKYGHVKKFDLNQGAVILPAEMSGQWHEIADIECVYPVGPAFLRTRQMEHIINSPANNVVLSRASMKVRCIPRQSEPLLKSASQCCQQSAWTLELRRFAARVGAA